MLIRRIRVERRRVRVRRNAREKRSVVDSMEQIISSTSTLEKPMESVAIIEEQP